VAVRGRSLATRNPERAIARDRDDGETALCGCPMPLLLQLTLWQPKKRRVECQPEFSLAVLKGLTQRDIENMMRRVKDHNGTDAYHLGTGGTLHRTTYVHIADTDYFIDGLAAECEELFDHVEIGSGWSSVNLWR
jgi:hypothetical protein